MSLVYVAVALFLWAFFSVLNFFRALRVGIDFEEKNFVLVLIAEQYCMIATVLIKYF
jgi:hypothetical protein